MRNPTEMMRAILKNPKAQEIIDYVSPIYGESYIGLWNFEAIGTALGLIYDIAAQLRYEGNPATSDLLLDYWESHYGIPKDSSMTKEQRRAKILGKIQFRAPYNPAVMENAISAAYGGVKVEITENVGKNTFLVNIREAVDSLNPAVAILERMKPAHLIYQIRVATQTITETEVKIAIAMTRTERFRVEVQQ